VYFDQNKAWSDTRTFTCWFYKVFLPHVHSKIKDKVLLIMDNCGPHGADISNLLQQVKMIPLPPNCTAVHQPMDQQKTWSDVRSFFKYCRECWQEQQVLRKENWLTIWMCSASSMKSQQLCDHGRSLKFLISLWKLTSELSMEVEQK
jgi:hypothetical protein